MKVNSEHMDFSPGLEESLAARFKVEEIVEKIRENNILYFIQPCGSTRFNLICEVPAHYLLASDLCRISTATYFGFCRSKKYSKSNR